MMIKRIVLSVVAASCLLIAAPAMADHYHRGCYVPPVRHYHSYRHSGYYHPRSHHYRHYDHYRVHRGPVYGGYGYYGSPGFSLRIGF